MHQARTFLIVRIGDPGLELGTFDLRRGIPATHAENDFVVDALLAPHFPHQPQFLLTLCADRFDQRGAGFRREPDPLTVVVGPGTAFARVDFLELEGFLNRGVGALHGVHRRDRGLGWLGRRFGTRLA